MDALEQALKQIEKDHGKGSIYRMGEKEIVPIDVIPTGNLALDIALGVGGYARGRIVEIVGPESAGKSTLCMHAVAEAQKLGLVTAYVDAEHAMDPGYARDIGVDVDAMLISQPDSGEEALQIALTLIKSGAVGLVIIDSVAALTPRAEINGEIGDSHVGLQARLMSQSMRLYAAAADKTNTTVIFVNQIREKIGVMYGSNETSPGGRALRFYASQRLDIRKKTAIKDGTDVIGNDTKVKVVKNKVAPPFKECEFEIIYGQGMSQAKTLLDLGLKYGILGKSGNTYADWNGEKFATSKSKAVNYLKDETVSAELYARVVEAINVHGTDIVRDVEDDDYEDE